MGTGGGRQADKPHSMEKECPSGSVGNTAQKISKWGLGKFSKWVLTQDYHSRLDRLKYPPPIACSTVSQPTLPHLTSSLSLWPIVLALRACGGCVDRPSISFNP